MTNQEIEEIRKLLNKEEYEKDKERQRQTEVTKQLIGLIVLIIAMFLLGFALHKVYSPEYQEKLKKNRELQEQQRIEKQLREEEQKKQEEQQKLLNNLLEIKANNPELFESITNIENIEDIDNLNITGTININEIDNVNTLNITD